MSEFPKPSFAGDLEEYLRLKERERREERKIITLGQLLADFEAGLIPFYRIAHERLHRAAVVEGVEYISAEKDSRRATIYSAFSREGPPPRYTAFGKFYGIDDIIHEFMSYLLSPVLNPGTSEEELQMLVLISPTGAGKSTLIDALIKLLEKMTMWRIYGCPRNEHPLWLLPRRLRPLQDDEAEEEKMRSGDLPESAKRIRRRLKKLGLIVQGDICPICKDHLLNGWPDAKKVQWKPEGWSGPIPLLEFPVEQVEFSKRSKIGYFEVPLTGREELVELDNRIGFVDISKIPTAESEADVAVLTLAGAAFSAGNQGIVEYPEIWKRGLDDLKIVIGATQDRMVPLPGPHGYAHFDGVIIGHSNWEEFERKRKPGAFNEALMRRARIIYARYNLFLQEEIRAIEQRLRPSMKFFEYAPHAIELVAELGILSRYLAVANITPLQKMDVLDGKKVFGEKDRELKPADVLWPDANHYEDGLREAISSREELKLFGRLLPHLRARAKVLGVPFREGTEQKIPVMPADVILFLPDMVKDFWSSHKISDEQRKKIESYIIDIVQRYHEDLEREIRPALIANFPDMVDQVFISYMQNIVAWSDPSAKTFEPDEEFMKAVEVAVRKKLGNVKEFRREKADLWLKHKKENPETHYRDLDEDTKNGFEEFVFGDIVKLTHKLLAADILSEEDRRHRAVIIDCLRSLGYSEISAALVIEYYFSKVHNAPRSSK